MSLLMGVGGPASATFALPLVDDVVDSEDGDVGLVGDLEGSLESSVDDVETAVEEVVDPLVGEVVDVVDVVDDDVGDPDVVTTRPPVSSGDGPPGAPELDSSSLPDDGPATESVPSAEVISTLEAGEDQAALDRPSPSADRTAIDIRSDDRLEALLLAGSRPSTMSAETPPLDGVLAWLTEGPTIARVLAAPLALLGLLVRALLSAGSGLLAPLSLTAAIVIRQLYRARHTESMAPAS